MKELAVGEWIVGDKGYRDGMQFCIPKGYGPGWLQDMTAAATARHETVNGRLKRFGILSQRYRQELEAHEATFLAVTNVVNCEMAMGYQPMEVYYDDTGFLDEV